MEIRDPSERASFLDRTCAATAQSAGDWSDCSTNTSGPELHEPARRGGYGAFRLSYGR